MSKVKKPDEAARIVACLLNGMGAREAARAVGADEDAADKLRQALQAGEIDPAVLAAAEKVNTLPRGKPGLACDCKPAGGRPGPCRATCASRAAEPLAAKIDRLDADAAVELLKPTKTKRRGRPISIVSESGETRALSHEELLVKLVERRAVDAARPKP